MLYRILIPTPNCQAGNENATVRMLYRCVIKAEPLYFGVRCPIDRTVRPAHAHDVLQHHPSEVRRRWCQEGSICTEVLNARSPSRHILSLLCGIGADGSAGSEDTRHVRCINIANWRHAFNVADTDIAGSNLRWWLKGNELGAIRYRWFHAFTAPCSHVGAAWASDIYDRLRGLQTSRPFPSQPCPSRKQCEHP
jgi:hypothetical protein